VSAALVETLTRLGWEAALTADGRVEVELDPPSFRAEAREEDGAVRLRVELGRAAEAPPEARAAAARFLAALAGGLTSVEPDGIQADRHCLEARLPSPAPAEALDLALVALSVGCRLGAREVRALADGGLARLYLTLNPIKET